jgi:hypothetical protein
MKKLFNKKIITKIFIIFIIGFFSRVLINYFENINIFVENYFIICFILIINEILLNFQLDIFTFFNYIYLLLKNIYINNKITLTNYYINYYYLENKNIIFTNNVNNYNISLKDKVRRYSHWIIWEKYKDESNSYKEFKNNWKPEKKIRKEIINDLKKELSDKHRDSVRIKRTIQWIINVFRNKKE